MPAPASLAVPTNRAGVASPRSCRLASLATTPAPWPARSGSTAHCVLREVRVREREGECSRDEGRGLESRVESEACGGSGSGRRGRACVGRGG